MRRLLLVLALILAVACAGKAGTPTSSDASSLATGTLVFDPAGDRITLRVEIAETEEERQRGLMGRAELEDDGGMVFLFEASTDGGFWMKDTLIPLSIAFWGNDERIAAIMEMEPCREETCPLYRPGVTYVAAVEVNRGFFEDNGVEVGDDVELQR